MNIQEVQALTDDEIRVKVAELQGWENVHRFNKWQEGGPASCKDGDLVGDFNGRTRCHLPNYPADLNACHEVFKAMGLIAQIEWHSRLYLIVRANCADNIDEESVRMVAVNATARQRCEALILTLTQP